MRELEKELRKKGPVESERMLLFVCAVCLRGYMDCASIIRDQRAHKISLVLNSEEAFATNENTSTKSGKGCL